MSRAVRAKATQISQTMGISLVVLGLILNATPANSSTQKHSAIEDFTQPYWAEAQQLSQSNLRLLTRIEQGVAGTDRPRLQVLQSQMVLQVSAIERFLQRNYPNPQEFCGSVDRSSAMAGTDAVVSLEQAKVYCDLHQAADGLKQLKHQLSLATPSQSSSPIGNWVTPDSAHASNQSLHQPQQKDVRNLLHAFRQHLAQMQPAFPEEMRLSVPPSDPSFNSSANPLSNPWSVASQLNPSFPAAQQPTTQTGASDFPDDRTPKHSLATHSLLSQLNHQIGLFLLPDEMAGTAAETASWLTSLDSTIGFNIVGSNIVDFNIVGLNLDLQTVNLLKAEGVKSQFDFPTFLRPSEQPLGEFLSNWSGGNYGELGRRASYPGLFEIASNVLSEPGDQLFHLPISRPSTSTFSLNLQLPFTISTFSLGLGERLTLPAWLGSQWAPVKPLLKESQRLDWLRLSGQD